MEQSTRMGLVEYIGAKKASFSVAFNPTQGRTVNRMWAAIGNDQSPMIKQRRWLPEPEALFYNAFAEFRLLRWGSSVSTQPVRTPVVTAFSEPIPEPQALPLHVLMQQQRDAMMAAAPPSAIVTKDVEDIGPQYLMSSSGTVHKPECSSAKRIKTPVEFHTMEEVTADPNFKKFHSCCEGLA